MLNQAYERYIEQQESAKAYLGCTSTAWALTRTSNNPGFFTPFEETMTLEKSLRALVGMPILSLGQALILGFASMAMLYMSVANIFSQSNDLSVAFLQPLSMMAGVVVTLGVGVLLAVNAGVELLKEAIALVTRSLTTISISMLNQMEDINKSDILDSKELQGSLIS